MKIRIKDPVINFPDSDISERIVLYILNFSKLQSNFQAYLLNITN
jgi:hypothetical protein